MNIVRNINKNIFREYDIRGVYPTDIDEDVSYTIGASFGTYIKKYNEKTCIVGHDNRLSSNSINNALIKGILSTGINVIDIGLVTTPMLYYSRIIKNTNASIMITASHNPGEDNGFKFSLNSVNNAKGSEITAFRDFTINNSFDKGNGSLYKYDIKNEYLDLFKNNLNFGNRKIKVVLDPANGTTCSIIKKLYSMFPLDIIYINDISDGTFPNHHPDPIVESNMEMLKKKVIETKADIGISFDGDGDRAGFIDEKGNMFAPDIYGIILVRELLKNNDNKNILYDIKCSSSLKDEINKLGGNPIENRTGASYMMDRVLDDNILFGIEYSGHIYFNNGFPPITSGLYAGLKLLEIMSNTDKVLSELYSNINVYYSTPEEKYAFNDEIKHKIVEKVKKYALDKKYKISLIDGVKVYFDDGWALVRCSNTGPNVTTRFEAKNKNRLNEIKEEFTRIINEKDI